MLVRGAELWKTQHAAFTSAFAGFAHMSSAYPLILWITYTALSELIPLAAAERPSAASQ
jgi:hypothetical protein